MLSDTLFASLISKMSDSMISWRCRVLTCPCRFFLLIMLFVCLKPGLKRNRTRARKYLKIKAQRKQYQNLCFSTSKSGLPRVISFLGVTGVTFKKIAPCGFSDHHLWPHAFHSMRSSETNLFLIQEGWVLAKGCKWRDFENGNLRFHCFYTRPLDLIWGAEHSSDLPRN